MIGTEERRESARTRTGSGRQTKVIGLGAVILALLAIGAVPRLVRDREALAAAKMPRSLTPPCR